MVKGKLRSKINFQRIFCARKESRKEGKEKWKWKEKERKIIFKKSSRTTMSSYYLSSKSMLSRGMTLDLKLMFQWPQDWTRSYLPSGVLEPFLSRERGVKTEMRVRSLGRHAPSISIRETGVALKMWMKGEPQILFSLEILWFYDYLLLLQTLGLWIQD